MSNRLILLSGVNGSDVASIAHAAVEAAVDEGLRVALVDDRPAREMPAEFAAAVGRAAAGVAAVLGSDRLPANSWTALPGMSAFATLADVAAHVVDPEIDVVVVECGDVSRLIELVRAPAAAQRVVDALLTPTLAMWRPPGGDAAHGDSPFAAVSALRSQLAALAAVIDAPSTTARIVVSTESTALARAANAAALVAMLGVGVDGVVVRRASRKGADKWAAVDEDARVDQLATTLAPIAVWVAGNKQRPAPKGRSVLGPFDAGVARLVVDDITIVAGDEDFVVDLPLLAPAREAARVGVRSGELVVEFDDVQRWVPLPPLLQRCRPTSAVRSRHGLRVHFVPDPKLWPDILAGEAA